MESNVVSIQADSVVIEQQKQQLPFPNDAVIVCAGGILPDGLLKEIGIRIETKHGSA